MLNQDYPHKTILSYTEDIKQKGVTFFSQFQVVFLALDNTEARSYVNSLCMALDIPILEAGTQGYLGQAVLFERGSSNCYDCWPRDL